MFVVEVFNYWIERYCIVNGLVKVDYYCQVFEKYIVELMKNVKVDNIVKMYWINVFDFIESRVMVYYMFLLCKWVFRFCVNRSVIVLNLFEGLLLFDVG